MIINSDEEETDIIGHGHIPEEQLDEKNFDV